MSTYYLNDQNQFVIENYDKTKTFASFLPSVAGVDGIPMWVYYVNRGQAISSFGVENKDQPILDFVPANIAYRQTEITGFRTFIKRNGTVHEIFSSVSPDDVQRRMIIDTNVLTIEEVNHTLQLKVVVRYFTATHENYPGLIRKIEITNLSNQPVAIELLDGLPVLWPAGVDNYMIKNMANLSVAWNDVIMADEHLPFYCLRSTTEDTAVVGTVSVGHFYATYDEHSRRLPIIYDADYVFAENTSFLRPSYFERNNLKAIVSSRQVVANKLPCAFTAFDGTIDKKATFFTVVGRMPAIEALLEKAKSFGSDYFISQEQKAFALGEALKAPLISRTAYPIFDAYLEQCFVDNLLRGGYPIVFKGKDQPIVYHVFSRIHGDMEREYNYFVVEPTYYSQGNGNFRDVNQNRRNDVYFVKEAGLFNIKQFMELIQLDGYNPLTIKGSSFYFDQKAMDVVLKYVKTKPERVKELLQNKFTPGKLLKALEDEKVEYELDKVSFLELILSHSQQEFEAAYGTGYWIDHWTYNLDLIENYLNVFPDDIERLLFEERFRSFESPVSVLPRSDKYVLMEDGEVRQIDAIMKDEEKIKRLGLNPDGTNWVKDAEGNVYIMPLYNKLLLLVLNKFASLDPFGIGIMMDAEKPGWNDAMNGLPSLFGSGVSETIELVRVIQFLRSVSHLKDEVSLPKELSHFFNGLYEAVYDKTLDEVTYFNRVQDLRENYRFSVRFGVSGKEESIATDKIQAFLERLYERLRQGLERALVLGKGIMPTFLTYRAVDYTLTGKTHPLNGLPTVHVTKWDVRPLPHFLEAPARLLKIIDNPQEAKEVYERVKASPLYDEKLKMYLTSVPLDDEPIAIGRIRAFTAGWLERESCFMHMEYKYLLGLLKSGLYDQFFEDIKHCLPPFMDPEVYGRSILENSSFIVSSRNPDPTRHGRGFVARLTGTTSEMLSMWIMMMTGKRLFTCEQNELVFRLEPILNKDFFDHNHEVRFKLLNQTDVIYRNPLRKHTYGKDGAFPQRYHLFTAEGMEITIDAPVIRGKYASWIRDGRITRIIVDLE